MTTLTAIALWGTLLMTQAGDDLRIEPGKQLPQSLNVKVGDKSAPEDINVRFLLFVPKDYQAEGQKWPLMLFLHGRGECGDDLNKVKIHGPAKIVETKPDFPFVLISPQCPEPGQGLKGVRAAWEPEQLIQLIDHVAGKLNVDKDRIYITGLSMGGYGTWRFAATYPERLAAAIPICGGGEPDKWAKALAKVPIWAFHGAKDDIVPLSQSQSMVDAIKAEHGDVQLTIYPDANHNSWAATYDNPKVYDWLLEHKLKK